MKERTYVIEGVSPIVMHNEQMADPLNKWSRLLKSITSKRKKTDEDLSEMARVEWFGGLYYDAEMGPYVPERCLEAMLRDAARKTKRGKDVVSGLLVVDPAKLEYQGSRDPDKLWASEKHLLRASVGVDRKRIIRSRPIFRDWSLSFVVNFDESVILGGEEIDGFLDIAGRLIGLLDWRPKHGRFRIVSIDGRPIA